MLSQNLKMLFCVLLLVGIVAVGMEISENGLSLPNSPRKNNRGWSTSFTRHDMNPYDGRTPEANQPLWKGERK